MVFRRTMSETDLTYLTLGLTHDVNVSMVFLLELDGELGHNEIRDELVRLAGTVPRFRQRVAHRSPWAENWSAPGPVRIDDHLTEVSVGEDGLGAVLPRLPDLLDRPFDDGAPPWQALYFRDAPDRNSVLVLRLHHSMGDGMTYLSALQQAFGDLGGDRFSAVEEPRRPGHGRRALAGRIRARAAAAARAAAGTLTRRGRAGLVNELRVWSPSPPPGRVGHTRSGQRVAMWTVPAEVWARAARELGGRRNDLFLAVTTFAESEYRGWPDGPAVTIMPINLRPGPDSDIEQDGAISIASGVVVLDRDHVRDGRLAHIGDVARTAREAALRSTYRPVVPDLMQLLPTPARRRLNLRLFSRSDLVASNVGGWARLRVGQAAVRAFGAVSPAVGCPVAFTLTTYGDNVTLVSTVDPGIIPDPGALEAAVDRALARFVPEAVRRG